MKRLLKSLGLGLAVLLALSWTTTIASTYGDSSYNSCTYSNGCPASSGSTSGSTSTTSNPNGTPILLNDFAEYTQPGGKDLTVTQGQVIDFDVTTSDGTIEHHSVTIQEIGPDYVVILILRSNPITVRFTAGQTQSFDVTGDGKNDIQITLLNVTGGQASFNFKALSPAPKPISPTATTTPANAGNSHLIEIIVSIGLIVVSIALFWWLWRRRKRGKPPTTTGPPT